MDNLNIEFDYSLDSEISGSYFGAPNAISRVKEGNSVGYPFQYDYVRIFHGTHRSVFYNNEYKPDEDVLDRYDNFANSTSILKQGYYRSRNDKLHASQLSSKNLTKWKNKMGREISNKTNGTFCSWLPSEYGEIIFDIVIPSSKVRINVGAGSTEKKDLDSISSLNEIKKAFNSPDNFVKSIDSHPERYEVILPEKIPIKNIYGVSNNDNRLKDRNFRKLNKYIETLSEEKLPQNIGKDDVKDSIREFEKLKKVYEVFNEGEVNPFSMLRSISELFIRFKVCNNKSMPKISVKDYEICSSDNKKVSADNFIRQNYLGPVRKNPEYRRKQIKSNAGGILSYIETYNEMVKDIHDIFDNKPKEIQVSSLGDIRSLLRTASKSHDIREAVTVELEKILECHKERIEKNKANLPKEKQEMERAIVKNILWFPMINIEPNLEEMFNQKASYSEN